MEELYFYIKEEAEHILKDIIKNPKEASFVIKFSIMMRKAKKRRESYRSLGKNIPNFLISSLNDECNLFCKGCVARNKTSGNGNNIKWTELFKNASKLGILSIIFAVEESFNSRDVLYEASKFKNIIFPVFTRGNIINDNDVQLFYESRNLIPIFNISDLKNYNAILDIINRFNEKGIYYGVCISIDKDNFKKLININLINDLYNKKCKGILILEKKELMISIEDRKFVQEKEKQFRSLLKDMIIVYFKQEKSAVSDCDVSGKVILETKDLESVKCCPFSNEFEKEIT